MLCLHSAFDPVKGVVIDYLHCVLLGVTKMLIRKWFDDVNKRKPFFIGHKVCTLHVHVL